MLLSFVGETAVSLRERGGVYFVPFPYHQQLKAMVATIEGVGDNSLYQLPLYDSPQTQHVLNTVAIATLDEELKKLDTELQHFMGADKTRRATMLKRLDAFDRLRARVATFAGVLTFRADDLQEKVNALQTELQTHLGLGEPTTPPAPVTTTVTFTAATDTLTTSTSVPRAKRTSPAPNDSIELTEEKARTRIDDEGNHEKTEETTENKRDTTPQPGISPLPGQPRTHTKSHTDHVDPIDQEEKNTKTEQGPPGSSGQETSNTTPEPQPWDDPQIEEDPLVDPFFTYDEEAGF